MMMRGFVAQMRMLVLLTSLAAVTYIQLNLTGSLEMAQPVLSLRRMEDTSTSPGNENANVLVVISSNRIEGIIPVIGSILHTTQSPVDVVLIGDHDCNERVRLHFGNRIAQLTSLSVDDVKEDLQSVGLKPIWTWDDWHTSVDNPDWFNVHTTIRPDGWDNRDVHAHELNHLRFYLPHMSIFRDREYLYFVDDDVIVQSDLAVIANETLAALGSDKGFVTPCNLWAWGGDCQNFRFSIENEIILDSTPIYSNRDICRTDSSTNCVPESYSDFLKSVMPEGGEKQLAWNFGFSLFALRNWRELRLTEKYEVVMRESYRLHVFPETSLTFGLGVSFIAFVGAVECWNDEKVKVRDGFGFIDYTRFEETFGEAFLETIDIVHYTGSAKPWSANSTIGEQSLRPWLSIMVKENMPIPPQLPSSPAEQLFTVVGSDQSDTDRIMRVLDSHPQICASGESDKPEIGFPSRLLDPAGIPWVPTCSIKKGCTFAFVRDGVLELTQDLPDSTVKPSRCEADDVLFARDDPLNRHLKQICNFVAELNGNFSIAAIARVWVDAYIKEDKRLLGCGCKRGAIVKGVSVLTEWLAYEGYPNEYTGPPMLELSDTKLTGSKVIRIKRRNIWARVKSRLIDEATQIWNPQTIQEKALQLSLLRDFTINVDDLKRRLQAIRDVDRAGDEWANEHASEVLWIDYADCMNDAAQCLGRIGDFLGIDVSRLAQDSHTVVSLFSPAGLDSSLDHVQNADAVQETLNEFNSGNEGVASA